MLKSVRNQAIALAGLAQTASLVQQVASKGSIDADAMETLITSVLKLDSESVEDVYGGLAKLKPGLRILHQQLSGEVKPSRTESRYVATLIYLVQKVENSPRMLDEIQKGVEAAVAQAAHFPLLHQNIVEKLADTYEKTVSQLRPHVMVQGEQSHLTNRANVAKIRTLLLAGIRSGILWRQCGGTRWKLFFNRKQLLAATEQLMKEI